MFAKMHDLELTLSEKCRHLRHLASPAAGQPERPQPTPRRSPRYAHRPRPSLKFLELQKFKLHQLAAAH